MTSAPRAGCSREFRRLDIDSVIPAALPKGSAIVPVRTPHPHLAAGEGRGDCKHSAFGLRAAAIDADDPCVRPGKVTNRDRRGGSDPAPLHLAVGNDATQFSGQRVEYKHEANPPSAFGRGNLLLAQVSFAPRPGNHVRVDAERDHMVFREHANHRLEDAVLVLGGQLAIEVGPRLDHRAAHPVFAIGGLDSIDISADWHERPHLFVRQHNDGHGRSLPFRRTTFGPAAI